MMIFRDNIIEQCYLKEVNDMDVLTKTLKCVSKLFLIILAATVGILSIDMGCKVIRDINTDQIESNER